MKAFGYVRVSTARQDLSPDAQRAQLEAYCAMKGYELVHVFEDVGVSAKVPFAERPMGAWMMALAEEVEAFVFAKLDRAFRNTADCCNTAEHLHVLRLSLHFLDLSIDTATPAGELCMTMLAALARFERRRISERITEALDIYKAQGRKLGPAPYGWANLGRVENGRKIDTGLHGLVTEEAEVCSYVVDLRKSGKTLRQIAAELTELKLPTRRGGKWSAENVRQIIARASA